MRKLSTYLKVMLTINANSFLYFLGKLPIINRLISPSLYKNTKLKLVFSFLGTIFELLKGVIGQSILVLALIHYLPLLLQGRNLQEAPALGLQATLFIVLMCVLPAFLQSAIFRGGKEDFIFLNHFSVNPDEYYRVKTGTALVRQFVSLFPILLFIFNDVITVFMLISLKIAFVMIGNIFFLQQYKAKRKLTDVKIRLLLMLIAIGLTYLGVYFGRIPSFTPSLIVAISLSLISLVITFLGWHFVTNYRNFKEVAVQFANKDVLTLRVSVTTPLNEDDTGLKSMGWTANQQFWEKNKTKKPAQYIEHALNRRFVKSIWNYVRQTLILSLIAAITMGLLIRSNVIKLDESNLLAYSPILISLVISMTYGTSYLQLCFRNLDLPLLYHHLYSRKRMVQSMISRAGSLMKIDTLLMASFAISLYLFLKISRLSLSDNLFFRLLAVYVLIFLIFELFHFLAYYALQPYSTELTVKSPLFTVLSIIANLFTVYFLFARENVLWLTQPLLIIAAALLLACVILTKFVDKTFKLRY